MKTRRTVAVLLSRFPLVTETFILREVEEMERQGQPVLLVPLLREEPRVVHREAEPWVRRALYTPFLSPAIAAANLRALRRHPRRYAGLVGRVLRGTAPSAGFLARTLALLPKSVYLAERLHEAGVGHVHAHFATHPALVAHIVSGLTGVPYSFTVHAHDLFVRRTFLEEKIRSARFVRVISRFNRDLLARLYPDAVQDKVHVIHAGVDPDDYGASSPEASGVPRLLCVAALKPYKGLPVLLEACRRLRDEGVAFRCDIVGDGPLRRHLEREIAARHLASLVHLLGPRRQDEVTQLLSRASLVVLPSVVAADGQTEGIPVSLMEAMAARRPVVASRLSGIPELIDDDESGWLVPPNDAAALATAVRRLLRDPELARRMGARGRAKVQSDFRLEDCVADLLTRIDAESEPMSPGLRGRLLASAPGACAVGVRRVHERPESSVAELLVSDGRRPRHLVLKVQRCPPAAESARHEFELLELLHDRFGPHAPYGVPRPVRFDEAGAALVMERCRGRPLDDVVRETRGSRDPAARAALVSAVERAGRWLRLFQQHTAREADVLPSGGPASSALAVLLSRARRDLETVSAAGAPGSFVRAARQRVDRLGQAVAPPAHLVGHHADFWPGNVYVDEGSVEVIDFEGCREGLPYEDAAYFLVQLRPFVAYPTMRGLLGRLERAFLEGYLDGRTLDAGMWRLCCTAKALQVLAQTGGPPAGRLRSWWRRRTLQAAALEGRE